MFETLGFQELVVILIIAVFIFGPSKIPAVGRGLGEGIRNFKKGIREASQIDDGSLPKDGQR
jgi:sec-independent protein translocase protein TatA